MLHSVISVNLLTIAVFGNHFTISIHQIEFLINQFDIRLFYIYCISTSLFSQSLLTCWLDPSFMASSVLRSHISHAHWLHSLFTCYFQNHSLVSIEDK